MDKPEDGTHAAEFAREHADYIRERLVWIKQTIERIGHGATLGFWVGETTVERQYRDDEASGRVFWFTALQNAKSGIKALEADDYSQALFRLLEAQAHMINALGVRLRPDDLHQLSKPAKRRGRPAGKKISPRTKK